MTVPDPDGHPRWIRHSDFYVPDGQPPGQPQATPSVDEVRRHHWGPLRQAPAFLLIQFIRLWRKLISPLYGQVCSFYPSCSAYGLEAVTVHGLLRGSVLTTWRILRCNPFSGGGINHVPAARRMWPEAQVPDIVRLNHPPMTEFEPESEPIHGA